MKDFKFVEVVSQINVEEITSGDVIIISDKSLSEMIRQRVFKLNSSYNGTIEMLDEISLATKPINYMVGKRVAICTTANSEKVTKQMEGMSKILQKLNLPEFCEFKIVEK